ncbi:MAG: PHP-associated domain-containing protein [Promethearchaeota archaeon]
MKSTELKDFLKSIYRRVTSKLDENPNFSTLKAKIQENISKIPSKTFLMDCHLHTQASDGKLSAQEYYHIGRAMLGERFLFTTTDHEILTNFAQAHLWGVELNCKTSSFHRMLGGFVHILSYFEDEPKNFTPRQYRYLEPIQVIEEIQSHEGIAVLAHIFAIGGICQPKVLEACDALELNANLPIWVNRKIRQWAKEYKKPVIAGSDAHNLKHFFDGITIFSQTTNLLDQIRKNKIQTRINVSFERLIPYYLLNLPSVMHKMIFRSDLQ